MAGTDSAAVVVAASDQISYNHAYCNRLCRRRFKMFEPPTWGRLVLQQSGWAALERGRNLLEIVERDVGLGALNEADEGPVETSQIGERFLA